MSNQQERLKYATSLLIYGHQDMDGLAYDPGEKATLSLLNDKYLISYHLERLEDMICCQKKNKRTPAKKKIAQGIDIEENKKIVDGCNRYLDELRQEKAFFKKILYGNGINYYNA